uniref:Putative postmeiotic segregation increased 2-like protein 11 n=2 Tax=Lygus hesperus TaxID=30085 RepID=A0A0A9XPW1_LYGHE
MECGLKRKLDCIADMEVLIHPHADPRDFEEQTKKMRLSVQLAAGLGWGRDHAGHDQLGASRDQLGAARDQVGLGGAASLALSHDHVACHDQATSCDGATMETEGDDKDLLDDIPSTSEVINSLRKVILWMSAQGEAEVTSDYIQYLSEVEKYAKSKQCTMAQQRKITQYLIRRDQ